jgi:hypothetical protein
LEGLDAGIVEKARSADCQLLQANRLTEHGLLGLTYVPLEPSGLAIEQLAERSVGFASDCEVGAVGCGMRDDVALEHQSEPSDCDPVQSSHRCGMTEYGTGLCLDNRQVVRDCAGLLENLRPISGNVADTDLHPQLISEVEVEVTTLAELGQELTHCEDLVDRTSSEVSCGEVDLTSVTFGVWVRNSIRTTSPILTSIVMPFFTTCQEARLCEVGPKVPPIRVGDQQLGVTPRAAWTGVVLQFTDGTLISHQIRAGDSEISNHRPRQLEGLREPVVVSDFEPSAFRVVSRDESCVADVDGRSQGSVRMLWNECPNDLGRALLGFLT